MLANKLSPDEHLLTALDAAEFLGVTPELLFAYVRHAPKSCLGHDKRLATVQMDHRTMFRSADLKDFDSYLWDPWSNGGDNRPAIPTYVSEYLKVECGGQCARCGKGFKLENAHIEDYSLTFSHHHHNLIRLCSHCHDEFDSKRIIMREEMGALKRQLIEKIRQRIADRTQWTNAITPPPSPTPIFVGREAELDAFAKALKSSRSVCVQGTAGIGKTQFVLQALNRHKFERPIVWVNVESVGTVSELELLLRAALSARIQKSAKKSLAHLLDAMKPCLIFDGVESITPTHLYQVEDFFSHLLQQTRSTTFVFTSQAELHSVHIDARFALGPLDAPASLEILQRSSDIPVPRTTSEQTALTWLIQFCDGHPLTLSVVASLLRYFKSTDVVADRIQRLGVSTLENAARGKQTRHTSLTTCLAVTYSALNAEERRVLFLVSHCPAGCPISLLDDFGKYGLSDPQMAIAGLRRWHLLVSRENRGMEKLYALSPICLFARSTFEHEEPAAAENIIYTLVSALTMWALVLDDIYIQAGDAGQGMGRYWEEFPNLTHGLDEAVSRSELNEQYSTLVHGLASSLQVFCFVSGFWRRGTEIMRLGANAALRSGRFGTASRLLLHLMILGRRLRDRELVRKTAEELIALTAKISDAEIAGNAAMAKGDIAQEDGRLVEARTHFEAAVEFYSALQSKTSGQVETGDSNAKAEGKNEKMVALALFELGRTFERNEEYREALEVYARAVLFMAETKDRVNLGSVLHHIGNCNAYLGNHELAFKAYVSAAQEFFEIGAAEHLSNSLSELGYLLIDYDPSVPLDLISQTLIDAGLSDALAEASERFDSEVSPLPSWECLSVVRKVFGMAALVSFTSWKNALHHWAEALREEIVRPLAVQLEGGVRDRAADGVPLMHLDVTTALIGSIAGSDGKSGKNARPSLAKIQHLASLCYRQYDWAWKSMRLFDWLAAYLSRCCGIRGVSAKILNAAAFDAEERGESFFGNNIVD